MGAGTHTHICARRHSQALDDALKLNGLALESMVSAVASSGSHHDGPPVPQHRVGWKERRKHKEDKDSYICMEISDCCAADTAPTLETLSLARSLSLSLTPTHSAHIRTAAGGVESYLSDKASPDMVSTHTERSHVNTCSSF